MNNITARRRITALSCHWLSLSLANLHRRRVGSAAASHPVQIKSGGKEYLERSLQTFTSSFKDNPVFTWLLQNVPLPKHPSVLPKLLRPFFHQALLNGGTFVQANDFSSCGLFLPPGARMENPWTMLQAGLIKGLWDVGRAMVDYLPVIDHSQQQVLTKEEQMKHWYKFIMATADGSLREGYASAIIASMLARARRDECPMWADATTLKSRNMLLKHDFVDAEEISMDVGKVDSDGRLKKGGEGIRIWPMVWRG
ncbi:hypothetical protein CDD80_3888 [Ophiocordyceps camponoti-rufipedis]|uniref:Uncharacterized protein n=1 Tax=Ophiocordyceps camponoti-rufipedis TaxID=2004952 RepID=A0A2C5YUY2_9HYPO|nr:hypothetical protein CDD80_3888 [Ophiocordyceps camponoti-rufipedis]